MQTIKRLFTSPFALRFYWNALYFGVGETVVVLTGMPQPWAIVIGAFLNGVSKEIKNHVDYYNN